MFAILWPFRHRLLKTRYFCISIGCVRLISASNAISNLVLDTFPTNDNANSTFTAATFITSVPLINGAYLAILFSIRRNQIPNSNNCKSMEQNRTLLFIMTALSIITCLPYGITITLSNFTEDLYSLRMQIIINSSTVRKFVFEFSCLLFQDV